MLRTGPTFVLTEERTLVLKHFCELKPKRLHRASMNPRCNMRRLLTSLARPDLPEGVLCARVLRQHSCEPVGNTIQV